MVAVNAIPALGAMLLLLGALAKVNALPEALPAADKAPCPCPKVHTGTTTKTVAGSGLTSTQYDNTVYEPTAINCHGYSTLSISSSGPEATTIVFSAGDVTSARYRCSSTRIPNTCRACPAGTSTTTIRGNGDPTSTVYGGTVYSPLISVDCHGSTALEVYTLDLPPFATVTVAETLTTSSLACSSTPSPKGCTTAAP